MRLGGALLGAAVTAACGYVDGIMMNMLQCDIRDGNVLHTPLIDLLEGETATPDTGAVGDGDITIAAIALGA